MSKPNIICIVSDTYRPDHIAANGQENLHTPELDAWLSKTITFPGARVSSFPTIPMRTDWLTGRFGMTRYGWKDLDPQAITLPQVLLENDYTTQLIADTTHMLRAGFHRPFQAYHYLRGHETDTPLTRLNEPMRSVVSDHRKTRTQKRHDGSLLSLADVQAHNNFRQRYEDESHCCKLADVICRWIEDNYKGNPFFLWADFFDVHEPWFPPQYLVDLYHPGYTGEPMVHPAYRESDVYSPEELANLRARYKCMCTLLSRSVGRIFQRIEQTGLLENTIVLFMSDHGMYLGEHGLAGKTLIDPGRNDNFPFYSELTNICWSMYVPKSCGLDVLPGGSKVDGIVQPPDLVPTLLELCGIDPPSDWELEGDSLVPRLTGQSNESPRGLAVTTSYPGRRPTVTDGKWTLLIGEPPNPRAPELYDIESDPTQKANLIESHREEAKRLHTAMLDWMKSKDATQENLARLSAEAVQLS